MLKYCSKFLTSSFRSVPLSIGAARLASSDVPSRETNLPYPYPEHTPKNIFEKMGAQTPDGATLGEFAVMRVDDMINLIQRNSIWYELSAKV